MCVSGQQKQTMLGHRTHIHTSIYTGDSSMHDDEPAEMNPRQGPDQGKLDIVK